MDTKALHRQPMDTKVLHRRRMDTKVLPRRRMVTHMLLDLLVGILVRGPRMAMHHLDIIPHPQVSQSMRISKIIIQIVALVPTSVLFA